MLLLLRQDRTHELESFVKQEISFIDSILRSPLHRQTKSPSLWHHRYWLLANFPGEPATESFVPSIIDRELATVFKSAEMHPKNYYAWLYARRRLTHLFQDTSFGLNSTSASTDLHEVSTAVLDWCLRHHSDTSGWSFLLWLLQQSNQSNQSKAGREQIMAKVTEMAKTFKWNNEALRSFVRVAISVPDLLSEEARNDITRFVTTNNPMLLAPTIPQKSKELSNEPGRNSQQT